MQVRHTWRLGAGLVLALLAGAILALGWLLPDRQELAARASAELEARLGVPVSVGALDWQLFPLPAVVVRDVATQQAPAVTVRKLTLYPELGALLDGRMQLQRAELDGAVLPQLSLRALDPGPTPAHKASDVIALARFVFRDLTWITRRGIAVVFEGEVDFDAGWRPRQAELRRPGVSPLTDLRVSRQGQEDRWTTRIRIGGGTADGEVELTSYAKGRLRLEGRLKPQGVEVASALAAFNRHSVIAGMASGDTSLVANGDSVGELAQTLHTRTQFSMRRATLLRFDLDKAVRTLGQDHAGQTSLDSVTGRMDTQNTAQGMVVTYTGVKATSGALMASGQARIAHRHINAEFAVDLVDGVIGVPLKVSGPFDKVQVSTPAGAVAGAVLGTAVLPGVGTAIGARIGSTLGKIFGSEPAPAKKPPRAGPP